MPNAEDAVRQTLLAFLKGGLAHVGLDGAVRGMPMNLIGAKPSQAPYSAWELLEHIRLTLHDLLEFSTNPSYRALNWPQDYWPASDGEPSEKAWEDSVRKIHDDLRQFESLLNDSGADLFAPIPWGKDQTLLREVLLAIDHASYHTGQLVLLRKQLGAWGP